MSDRLDRWVDTAEDDVCRWLGCGSCPIWSVETEGSYFDLVCGRHLPAYLRDFEISGSYGAVATLTRRDTRP